MVAACIAAPTAVAQGSYPVKPIKIIAPVQPGGGVDLVARTIADRLGRVLGVSIITDQCLCPQKSGIDVQRLTRGSGVLFQPSIGAYVYFKFNLLLRKSYKLLNSKLTQKSNYLGSHRGTSRPSMQNNEANRRWLATERDT
jgi:hypothetical protein